MKNKMDRVLEMVAAYPSPATDQEINSRLSSIVNEVVDKQLFAALSKQDERLKAIEESASKQIQNIDGMLMDVAKIHGFEIAERDRKIQDLEHLNLKLITAGATMVSMTKKALDGPNSSLAQIKTEVSQLLKTSSKAFDSMSKALSLSTSSILEGVAKLKLEEAVPCSKGGEEDEAKKTKPSPEKIDPEKIINLEKTPPSRQGEDSASRPQRKNHCWSRSRKERDSIEDC